MRPQMIQKSYITDYLLEMQLMLTMTSAGSRKETAGSEDAAFSCLRAMFLRRSNSH